MSLLQKSVLALFVATFVATFVVNFVEIRREIAECR